MGSDHNRFFDPCPVRHMEPLCLHSRSLPGVLDELVYVLNDVLKEGIVYILV